MRGWGVIWIGLFLCFGWFRILPTYSTVGLLSLLAQSWPPVTPVIKHHIIIYIYIYINRSISLPLPQLVLTTFFHSPRNQYSPIVSLLQETQPNPGSTMAHLRFPLPNGIPHEHDPLPNPHPEDDLFLDDEDGGFGVYFVELGIGYEEYQTRRLIFYFCLSLFLSFYTVAFYLFSNPDTIMQFPWVVR